MCIAHADYCVVSLLTTYGTACRLPWRCRHERETQQNIFGRSDFSEAYALSRNLALQGDKNGERLLKMVYMQLGWGAHRDYVQAYSWLSEGIADGVKYLVTWREKLIAKMTPDQLAQAKKTNSN